MGLTNGMLLAAGGVSGKRQYEDERRNPTTISPMKEFLPAIS
jgi:hypothetical protein